MFKKIFFLIFIIFQNHLCAISSFDLSYGSNSAPKKLTQYYSLSCSACLDYFEENFYRNKEEYIDSGKVQVTFKAFPGDYSTLFACFCLSQLDEENKKILFESCITEFSRLDQDARKNFLLKAMELMGYEIKESDFNSESKYVVEAFNQYQSLADKIKELPCIEVNKKMITGHRAIDRYIKGDGRV